MGLQNAINKYFKNNSSNNFISHPAMTWRGKVTRSLFEDGGGWAYQKEGVSSNNSAVCPQDSQCDLYVI